jgi:hypothetical protein
MYKIIISDFQTNKQHEVSAAYFLEARELADALAFNFVISREGERGFARGRQANKQNITKGYAMVTCDTPFSRKIKIYHKEQNGIVFAGRLTKIMEFFTVRINRPAQPHVCIVDEFEMAEYFLRNKENFTNILSELYENKTFIKYGHLCDSEQEPNEEI